HRNGYTTECAAVSCLAKLQGMRFKAKLFCYPGPGGWTFAEIPKKHAPPVTDGWGRTPVLARVDGRSWATSVWRERARGTLLPVPKKIRGSKTDGDWVDVELRPREETEVAPSTRARRSRG